MGETKGFPTPNVLLSKRQQVMRDAVITTSRIAIENGDISLPQLSETEVYLVRHQGSMSAPAFACSKDLITVKLEFVAKCHETPAVNKFQCRIKIGFKELDDSQFGDTRLILFYNMT